MQPFDLEKALAGEAVQLRDGRKAIILADVEKMGLTPTTKQPLIGIVIYGEICNGYQSWMREGNLYNNEESGLDIIGMWQEPHPRVQLDLPAPLKTAEDGQTVWFVNVFHYNGVNKCTFSSKSPDDNLLLEYGELFATEQDAKEWLNAMRGARR